MPPKGSIPNNAFLLFNGEKMMGGFCVTKDLVFSRQVKDTGLCEKRQGESESDGETKRRRGDSIDYKTKLKISDASDRLQTSRRTLRSAFKAAPALALE